MHMQVSSKHMMLASPVFKAMLTHSFQEGDTLRSTGEVEIPLPDDDPAVFTIILDIIHGRGRRVPRVVPLKLLALLSIVVDKYQLLEPVAVFSDVWINEAVEKLSAEKPAGWLLWLSISWVFRDAARFMQVTDLVLRNSREGDPLVEFASENFKPSLPIPQIVLGNFSEYYPSVGSLTKLF